MNNIYYYYVSRVGKKIITKIIICKNIVFIYYPQTNNWNICDQIF